MAVITSSSGGGFQCSQCAYVVFQYMEVKCDWVKFGKLFLPFFGEIIFFFVFQSTQCSGFDGNGFNIDDGGDYANFTAAHHQVFRGLNIHDIGTGGNSDCLKVWKPKHRRSAHISILFSSRVSMTM